MFFLIRYTMQSLRKLYIAIATQLAIAKAIPAAGQSKLIASYTKLAYSQLANELF